MNTPVKLAAPVTDRATMIRPGLMVSLKSSVAGGVSYRRDDLEAAQVGILDEEYEPGRPGKACTSCNSAWPADEPESHTRDCLVGTRAVTRWETTKVVDDPTEFARASKVRNAARALVAKHCARTSFGLLCPERQEAELDAGIAAARAMVAAHNATSTRTHVDIYVLKGRVASDDVAAVRAISSEVRDLVAEMTAGIDGLNPKRIRDAAEKAKEIGAMLSTEQADVVAEAVKQARAAARTIVARVEGKGEDAKVVLADVQRGSIERARMAFLDLDDGPGIVGAQMPAVDVQRFADLGEEGAA